MANTCPICNNIIADDIGKCPYCGFKMLGSTETFSPISVTVPLDERPQPVTHRCDFRIIRGPQTGLDIELRPGELSIGRDPRCDVFLNDMTVSRNHATLEVGPQGCIIRDQGSVNGVWVNDRVLEAGMLKPGDVVQIGAFCLLYRERP